MAAELQQALRLHQQGRLAEAIGAYEAILRAQPADADALHYLGVACRQNGRVEKAIALLRKSVEIRPAAPVVHNNLGNAYLSQERFAEALASFERAIELAPEYALAHRNRGVALSQLGRGEDALAAYRQVALLEPGQADAHYNMGVVLQELGRFGEAAQSYGLAVARAPDFFEAWVNRASALVRIEAFDGALAAAETALRLQPQSPEAHHNRGLALAGLKRWPQALAAQDESVRLRPGYAQAWIARGDAQIELKDFDGALQGYQHALRAGAGGAAHLGEGRVLAALGRFDEAVASYDAALAVAPDDLLAWLGRGYACSRLLRHGEALESIDRALALGEGTSETWHHHGHALAGLGRYLEAAESFRRAIALDPDNVDALCNLGHALTEVGEFTQAMEVLRRALALRPDYGELHINLGMAEHMLGRPEEAAAHFRAALRARPDNAAAYSNLLFVLAYSGLADAAAYLELARGWERAVLTPARLQEARERVFPRLSQGRRLKIGYVSGDFRRHPVSYFIGQVLAHHDRAAVEVYAYHAYWRDDEVTQRLRGLVEHWVPIAELSDEAARERIAADGIDVLVDLAGHTNAARLGIFARRAAPVQAHYIGYFASTGLTEMDYWIGDAQVTPAATDSDFSERVWRLPRTWMSYDGRAEAPPIAWAPAPDGAIRLGSFNNLRKLTPATLRLWARVLRALPEARLVLKTRELGDAANCEYLWRTLEGEGVARGRVELIDAGATPDWGSHMDAYNRLDLALDPVGGMGGATTTCDALWMGVPVITLAGARMASRAASSMVTALGHAEWVAADEVEYVARAVALARDRDALTALRAGARERMAASPLCDARDLARCLEAAYTEMSRGRHAGGPPVVG